MSRMNELERRQGEALSMLRDRVNAHDILIGDEARRTGLFGAMDRAFKEIENVGRTVREVRDMMMARENQAKGVGFAAKAAWAFVGAGGLYFIMRIAQAIGQ